MKTALKKVLHSLLGLHRFLFLFAIYKVKRIRSTPNEESLLLFAEFVKHSFTNGLIVDIGANIGITTAIIAQICQNNILAVEPTRLNSGVLHRVIRFYHLAQRVQVEKCALGSAAGECMMDIPREQGVVMHGLSRVVHTSDHAMANVADTSSSISLQEVVHLRTLDELLANTEVAAIKMDVENFEYEVLLGATTLLKTQHPPFIIELWNNQVRTKCFELLGRNGYKTYVCREHRLVPLLNWKDGEQDLDFIFLHETHQL